MKRLGFIVCLIALLTACKDQTKFTIDGKLTNYGSVKKVYLYGMVGNDMQAVDSTDLSEKGEFKFARASEGEDFFKIVNATNEYIFAAKNGDELQFKADITDKSLNYTLSGNESSEQLANFAALRYKNVMPLDSIKQEFERKKAENPAAGDSLLKVYTAPYMALLTQSNEAVLKFANDNASNLAGFYAINQVNPNGNEDKLIAYIGKVNDELKKNTTVKTFIDRISKMKTVQIGAMAPAFSINTIDGKTINLSDFKGKYTLIDFWASWCTPCREENPNVVKAYQTYKDRNFTILGISLDKDKAAWAQAVKQDGLTWTHASELADFSGETVRLYQVDAIPASFLLDPSGKIIAKNLRGEALDAFLKKTLP